jgi:polysaccharide export outer membrane protein
MLFNEENEEELEDNGDYNQTYVEETLKKHNSYEYKIVPYNRITVKVYNHPELSDAGFDVVGFKYMKVGHFVEKDGTINLPLIGRIKVVGLTEAELVALIEKEYSKYIKYAYVNIKILDKKIYVFGEVVNPGVKEIYGKQITLIEAISEAGGFTDFGKRDSIKIARIGEKNKPIIETIDLSKKRYLPLALLPLQPNDIVYVEPNNMRAQNLAIGEMTPTVGYITAITNAIINGQAITRTKALDVGTRQ